MPAPSVTDVTDATFESVVLTASRERPVVVDFWAPWCEPCKALTPLLEQVAGELGENVMLVKVNIDDNPGLAQAFQIQSIPAVKAIDDGKLVAEFVGAQSEPEVRAFFAGLLPAPADKLAEAGAVALRVRDLVEARRQFEAALALDALHGRATGGLAAVMIEEGDLDGAEALTSRAPGDPYVKRQIARLRFERGAAGTSEPELVARIEANAGDVDARYRLGCHLARRAEWADAMEQFLEVVMLDRKYQEDAGRLASLDVFEVVGSDDPLTVEYRSRLTMLLF
ncbi:MAG: tetratricopeptide repeat protein [Vicinamibacterales bacterium]